MRVVSEQLWAFLGEQLRAEAQQKRRLRVRIRLATPVDQDVAVPRNRRPVEKVTSGVAPKGAVEEGPAHRANRVEQRPFADHLPALKPIAEFESFGRGRVRYFVSCPNFAGRKEESVLILCVFWKAAYVDIRKRSTRTLHPTYRQPIEPGANGRVSSPESCRRRCTPACHTVGSPTHGRTRPSEAGGRCRRVAS